MNTDFKNAVLVLPEQLLAGGLSVREGLIQDIAESQTSTQISTQTSTQATTTPTGVGSASVVDCGGDYLLPGLIELHTDNMERHVIPRPKTFWPNMIAAAMAHDAEMAASGVTTVFDSTRVGAIPHEDKPQNRLFMEMQQAIHAASDAGAFRIDHRLHIRCELTDPGIMEALEPAVDVPLLGLVSLMDHTPGQRQWRDLDALRRHNSRGNRSESEIDSMIQKRIDLGQEHVPVNRIKVLERFKQHQHIVLASHDDTTEQHVLDGVADGVDISEFPCSLVAAKTAKQHGLHTIMGAPNVVRGGSHSGNVSATDLIREDVLDGLSSDYVPASLLQAVFLIAEYDGWDLAKATRLVTGNNADMAKLSDRGRLAIGLRGDLIRVAVVANTPVVREVYVGGVRVL